MYKLPPLLVNRIFRIKILYSLFFLLRQERETVRTHKNKIGKITTHFPLGLQAFISFMLLIILMHKKRVKQKLGTAASFYFFPSLLKKIDLSNFRRKSLEKCSPLSKKALNLMPFR